MMSFHMRLRGSLAESRRAGTAPPAKGAQGRWWRKETTEDLLTKLPITPLLHQRQCRLQTPTEPQGPCLMSPQPSAKGSTPSGRTINAGSGQSKGYHIWGRAEGVSDKKGCVQYATTYDKNSWTEQARSQPLPIP